jgi:hypothetical protein
VCAAEPGAGDGGAASAYHCAGARSRVWKCTNRPFSYKQGAEIPLLEREVLCVELAFNRAGFGGYRLRDMVLVIGFVHVP